MITQKSITLSLKEPEIGLLVKNLKPNSELGYKFYQIQDEGKKDLELSEEELNQLFRLSCHMYLIIEDLNEATHIRSLHDKLKVLVHH